MAINDSISVAVTGILSNKGLSLTGASALLTQLAAAPVISQGLAAVAASSDNILGYKTLPGLTGVVPFTISNIGSGPGIPFYNTQITSLTNTNNILGFLSNLSQIYGYCSLASTYSVEMMNSLVSNTMGFSSQKNTQAYTLTSGLSTLLTTPTQIHLSNLATDLLNTGTLYDITDLPNLGTPGKIYSALLTANIQGAVNAQTSLSNAGVDLTNLTDPVSQNTILRALTNINSTSDINAIISAFSLNISAQFIANAGVLTQFASIFIKSSALMTVSSFSTLSVALQGINLASTYLTLSDLGDLLTTITYPPNFDTNGTTNVSVTPDLMYSFVGSVGIGSSIGGTVSVADFMQILDPKNLSNLVNTQITNLTNLSKTTDGQNLIALFNTLVITPPISQPPIEAQIETALSNLLSGTGLSSQYAIAANQAWIQIMSMLSISIQAISNSGVSLPSSAVNNKIVALGIAQSFPSFGQDPNNLGAGQLLVNLATSDIYGIAIQNAINLTSS
jgi:hypothetical protein